MRQGEHEIERGHGAMLVSESEIVKDVHRIQC